MKNLKHLYLPLLLILVVTAGASIIAYKSIYPISTHNTTESVEYTALEPKAGSTASISQGPATIITENIYECDRGRIAPVGTSTASDGSAWTVPALVNFTDSSFPSASDLFNPCTKIEYNSANEAVLNLDEKNIIEVDTDGELITAFVFADNYFEMYINGTPVGKDTVPFTQFNSNIIQFKAKRPFTIAMKLVDWEENSGLGSESNGGKAFHPGDGGMVAVFKDVSGTIIATTNTDWKAQTFYTAPIQDISCISEEGSLRLSDRCSTISSNDGTSYYALHWATPADWQSEEFDDSTWPNATEFTNSAIGVDNKPAYTNFIDIFDNQENDARFIWSSNVILDNEVIVRHTVL